MEQWMEMNRKKNVEPKQRRKRTREAPRCYSRSIEEGTNARGYPKSKKKKTARDEHTPSASAEKSEPMLKAGGGTKLGRQAWRRAEERKYRQLLKVSFSFRDILREPYSICFLYP